MVGTGSAPGHPHPPGQTGGLAHSGAASSQNGARQKRYAKAGQEPTKPLAPKISKSQGKFVKKIPSSKTREGESKKGLGVCYFEF